MHGDKADKNVTVSGTELFSFGAGEFVKQAEASDVKGDHEGRWIAFGLNGDSFVILEGQKTLPDHLKTLSVLGQATWRKLQPFGLSGLCFKDRIFWRKNDGTSNFHAWMGSNR